MLRALMLFLALLAGLGAAVAQPLDERAARKLLFPAGGFEFVLNRQSGLTEQQLGFFNTLFTARQYRDELSGVARYYGAAAISPALFERLQRGELNLSQGAPFQFSEGYHSPAAAEQAALRDCAAALKPGEAPCVVAARLLPKRFKPRGFTMSMIATEAFKSYRSADAPKAFAISRGSRAFAVKGGTQAAAAALASCNETAAKAGRADCLVVIAD